MYWQSVCYDAAFITAGNRSGITVRDDEDWRNFMLERLSNVTRYQEFAVEMRLGGRAEVYFLSVHRYDFISVTFT